MTEQTVRLFIDTSMLKECEFGSTTGSPYEASFTEDEDGEIALDIKKLVNTTDENLAGIVSVGVSVRYLPPDTNQLVPNGYQLMQVEMMLDNKNTVTLSQATGATGTSDVVLQFGSDTYDWDRWKVTASSEGELRVERLRTPPEAITVTTSPKMAENFARFGINTAKEMFEEYFGFKTGK